MHKNSPQICSNQQGVHPDLGRILKRYQESDYIAPISERSRQTYEMLLEEIEHFDMPLILDSGCGNGESTVTLGKMFPEHFVIGIDKSHHRLQSGRRIFPELHEQCDNVIAVRAELVDLWRLFADDGVFFDYHFLLYQNPWPKKKHVRRRWHAHPVFPIMLELSDSLTMRTNWHLYAQEFCSALELVSGVYSTIQTVPQHHPITPFERKFLASGHTCYEVLAKLPEQADQALNEGI
ncbi:MAG: hypothetical protein KDD62_14905 [Bdellovibrionales bacterium]|nr:hypothetical protein [Bdellovibrionales bacterium]